MIRLTFCNEQSLGNDLMPAVESFVSENLLIKSSSFVMLFTRSTYYQFKSVLPATVNVCLLVLLQRVLANHNIDRIRGAVAQDVRQSVQKEVSVLQFHRSIVFHISKHHMKLFATFACQLVEILAKSAGKIW